MSAVAMKFDEREFDTLWESIKPNGGITIGTLIHYAKESGWLDPFVMATLIDDTKDIKNARLFAEANLGKLLFIPETGDVLKFSPEGWVRAPIGEADKAAKAVVSNMREEAAELYKQSHDNPEAKKLSKHADFSSTSQRIQAMVSLAKSEDGMSESLSNFDVDPNLIGVGNGVLNLKLRYLLKVTPSIRVSMRANVSFDPQMKCPVFLIFLLDIQPDQEVRRLLQQIAGVFLCGNADLQKLIFFYGHGLNGKTTFIELFAWLLGDYARRIATEMLMQHQRSPQGPSPDIVGLKGRRMVYCSEVEEGRHLAEGRVKEMTGGDTLSGRVPYAKDELTFQPTHKLVMVGNHQPEIHDNSHGMWRRVLLIPFEQTIPKEKCDPALLNKLKSEGSGILNWMVDGYHDYLENGLQIPLSISAAIDVYKDEEDIIGEWVKDHCKKTMGMACSKQHLYRAYTNWARSHGHNPLAQKRFTKRLSDRGFKLDPGRRNIVGIELNAEGFKAVNAWI